MSNRYRREPERLRWYDWCALAVYGGVLGAMFAVAWASQ